MCSDKFDLDPHVANNMVTVYWIAYASGRFSAMIVAKVFQLCSKYVLNM